MKVLFLALIVLGSLISLGVSGLVWSLIWSERLESSQWRQPFTQLALGCMGLAAGLPFHAALWAGIAALAHGCDFWHGCAVQ